MAALLSIAVRGNRELVLTAGAAADDADEIVRVEDTVRVRHLDGQAAAVRFGAVERSGGVVRAAADWAHGDRTWRIVDEWTVGEGFAELARTLVVGPGTEDVAVHVQSGLAVAAGRADLRPFVPAHVYETGQLPETGVVSYGDGRLPFPMIGCFDAGRRRMLVLLRATPADHDRGASRAPGQSEYAHDTDLGSLGLSLTADRVGLLLDMPYYEGPGTAALDAAGSPGRAYLPVPAGGLRATVRYRVAVRPAADYPAAVRAALGAAVAARAPVTPPLPFPLRDAVRWRRESAAHTYREWGGDGAGFVLNFDPDHGYDSEPRAFGASFTEHGMGSARDILEYGFTGRQLDVARVLAESGAPWCERRRRVCDFFVRHMVTDQGFAYSHYDVARDRPLFSVGDPDGPVLHYLVRSDAPGSYLRLMTETAGDLLRNCRAVRAAGDDRPEWWGALRRIGGFLLRAQAPDGSWARAYGPDAAPIVGGEWLGEADTAASATAAPVPFLLALADELDADGDTGLAGSLRRAADRAGDYLLDRQAAPASYRGGTLDNPNVVDKESAFMAMSAMLALHRRTGRRDHLDAAERAARIAVSWTVLWDIPTVPGTRVHAAGVRSTGWGGINSVWGAGVTDIYSLFFLTDLVDLARRVDDPLLVRIAELTAAGTAQLLAHPGDRFGMADVGMQPEGIAHAPQGVDAGLIAKGDVWGGLGWIYTAGTSALADHLDHHPGDPTAVAATRNEGTAHYA